MVSNTYCVAFLFSFSSSCAPHVVNFSGYSICIAPSILSYVFLIKEIILYLIVIQLSVFQQNSVYVVCKITIFIAFHKYFNVIQ